MNNNVYSFINEFGLNLLIGLIIAIFTWVISRFSMSYHIRPIKRLWSLPNDKNEIYVLYGDASQKKIVNSKSLIINGSTKARVDRGDVEAYGRILSTLESIFPKSDFKGLPAHLIHPEILKDKDFILVGGPIYNIKTRDLFRELHRNSFPLKYDDIKLIGNRTCPDISYSPIEEDGRVITDFGLIIRLRNPWNKDKSVFLFSGCDTYGVLGSSKLFSITKNKSLRKIQRNISKLSKYNYFAIILQVQALKWDIGDIITKHQYTIHYKNDGTIILKKYLQN